MTVRIVILSGQMKKADFESMSTDEIVKYVVETSVQNVTLTGGEPLIQPGISGLIKTSKENDLNVEIETNGAVNLENSFCLTKRVPIVLQWIINSPRAVWKTVC